MAKNTRAQELSEIHSSMPNDVENAVRVHTSNFDSYGHEEIFVKLDEIVDSENTLGDFEKIHCNAIILHKKRMLRFSGQGTTFRSLISFL